MTRSREATLRALARAVLERRIDFSAAPEEVVAALAALPGIGSWTAQYVALRALGEPDAMPTGDLVLRRMAAPGQRLLSARELGERARVWRPWRGYAVMHLWHAAAAARALCTRPVANDEVAARRAASRCFSSRLPGNIIHFWLADIHFKNEPPHRFVKLANPRPSSTRA